MRKVRLYGSATLLALVAFPEYLLAFNCNDTSFPGFWTCAELRGNVYCENNVVDGFAESECMDVCSDFSLPYHSFECENGSQTDVLGCFCTLS